MSNLEHERNSREALEFNNFRRATSIDAPVQDLRVQIDNGKFKIQIKAKQEAEKLLDTDKMKLKSEHFLDSNIGANGEKLVSSLIKNHLHLNHKNHTKSKHFYDISIPVRGTDSEFIKQISPNGKDIILEVKSSSGISPDLKYISKKQVSEALNSYNESNDKQMVFTKVFLGDPNNYQLVDPDTVFKDFPPEIRYEKDKVIVEPKKAQAPYRKIIFYPVQNLMQNAQLKLQDVKISVNTNSQRPSKLNSFNSFDTWVKENSISNTELKQIPGFILEKIPDWVENLPEQEITETITK